jgi:predicted ATP-grasp superfamily ATP-dependent carboligase
MLPCAEWSRTAVLDKLIEFGRGRRRRPSLLITKEESVRWISDAREQLAEYYEINLPKRPIVDLLLDKAEVERLWAAEGWPVPRTWRIESKDDLLSALPEISYPCILKPRVKSAAFGDRSPRKAFKIADADQLLRT